MPDQLPVGRSERQRHLDVLTSPSVSDEILDYKQVARLMRVSQKTVERLALGGELPSSKLGDSPHARRVFLRSEVMAYITRRRAS
jgi:excisionase family DNA binding protein